MKSEAELNEYIIKMVACLQVGLEYMDEFTHSKLYSKGAKFHAKALAKELESKLGLVYNQFRDGEDEDTYLNIERGIREFVAQPIADIYTAGEREQAITPCSAHAREQDRLEWEMQEEEMNKRMDIIGTNGNEGEHYQYIEDEQVH
jgi:hypothetical protein